MERNYFQQLTADLRRRRGGKMLRQRALRPRLWLEPLEDRLLPSVTPHLLKDVNAFTPLSVPYGMVQVGSVVYFAADDGVHGIELWKSDGTAAGTVLVKDVNAGGVGSGIDDLVNVRGTLFFSANDGMSG